MFQLILDYILIHLGLYINWSRILNQLILDYVSIDLGLDIKWSRIKYQLILDYVSITLVYVSIDLVFVSVDLGLYLGLRKKRSEVNVWFFFLYIVFNIFNIFFNNFNIFFNIFNIYYSKQTGRKTEPITVTGMSTKNISTKFSCRPSLHPVGGMQMSKGFHLS